MRFKSLKYRGKELTERLAIERALIDSGNGWLLDCETENAELEIFKGKLKWNAGQFYCGIWMDGEWHNGDWFYGIWMNGRWFDGHWKNGTWTDGIWENGRFDGGTVIRGIFKNTYREN